VTPEEEFEAAPSPEAEFDAAPPEPSTEPLPPVVQPGPSLRERILGSLVSFTSGSPLFGTVADAAGALGVGGRGGSGLRRDAEQATKQFSPTVAGVPVLPVLGSVAATLPAGAARIGTLGVGASRAARVGLQGTIGAVSAADRGGDAGDVALGTVTGLGGGLGGEFVGAVGSRIAKGAASRIGDVVATRAAKDAADVAADVAAAEGRYGAATQALNRTGENLNRSVAGLPPTSGSLLPVPTQQRALNALTDPDTIKALTEVAERDIANLPTKTADYLRLQAAAQAARAGAPAEAAKRTSDYFNTGVLRGEVVPRLGPLAQRAALAAAAGGVTSMLDGGFGVGVGSVMGAQGLLTMGRNVAKSPRVQRAALEGMISGIGAANAGLRRLGTAAGGVRATQVDDSARSVADPLGPLRQYLDPGPTPQTPPRPQSLTNRTITRDEAEAVDAFLSAP